MMRYLFYCISAALFIATTALAQTDTGQFNIRVFTGTDDVAPTTPVLQSAIPVATTQIDVSWGVATDNFALGGYVLFRDGAPLATTTLTNFSDTSLTPSTTYSYTVQAFDLAGNYSSSSNALQATTLDLPPPPPPVPTSTPASQTGTAVRTVLDELSITPGVSTTSFAISTARPARFEIRFGRTASYELGFSINETFLREYRTTLTDLEPGTVYEYEIIGYSPLGTPTILKRGQFTTLGIATLSAPQNVSRFTAQAEDSDVVLSWQLPFVAPGDVVRIVRSHLGYPTHPQAGAVVYEGTGITARDEGVLEQFSPVYYTAFVIAESGRVSSGAVAQVFTRTNEPDTSLPEEGFAPPPPIQITDSEQKLPEFRLPDPSDITFFQTNIIYTFGQPTTTLSAAEPLTISIPKAALAQNLKTIIATITDPQNGQKTYSFLLRINNDDTAYEATLAPLGVEGVSQLTITVYDFEARVVGTRSHILVFEAERAQAVPVWWPDYFIEHYQLVLSSFALLILLLVVSVFYIRTRT